MQRYRTIYKTSKWATPMELSRRLGVHAIEFQTARKLNLLVEGTDFKVIGTTARVGQLGHTQRLYDRDRVIREWPRIARILRESYMRTPFQFRKWYRENFGSGTRVAHAV